MVSAEECGGLELPMSSGTFFSIGNLSANRLIAAPSHRRLPLQGRLGHQRIAHLRAGIVLGEIESLYAFLISWIAQDIIFPVPRYTSARFTISLPAASLHSESETSFQRLVTT